MIGDRLMNKYRCIQDFYVDKYDENGFCTDKQYLITKDSIWELSCEKLEIAVSPCVRLERVWKSKRAKTRPWIEIMPEHLEQFFEKMEAEK